MKDGSEAGQPADVSRQVLRQDYVNWYLQQREEVRPCRDLRLMELASQYLQTEPESGATFTVFPFYQFLLNEGHAALCTDCRKHLSAFIKATELLETLCFNLFLQPWRKEIRTLKTYTGPFVYCLMPVLSTASIQSVLASIGYLPHEDAPHSEFRLCKDADADKAMLVGFELLLARVECQNLLKHQQNEQLRPHELLEVIQRRIQPTKLTKLSEQKTAMVQKEQDLEEKTKVKEGFDIKEDLQYCDTKPAVSPRPKPRRSQLVSPDHSLIEMQQTYPDLAFRGRPLLPDKSHKAHNSMSRNKAAQPTKAARRGSTEGAKAAAALSRKDDGRDDEASVNNGGASEGLGGPHAISLHMTLRAGLREEENLKAAEPPPYNQLQADRLKKTAIKPEFASLSSLDEELELRGLAERMEQVDVHERNDEWTRKEDQRGAVEEPKGRQHDSETGAAPTRDDNRRSPSSQPIQRGVRGRMQLSRANSLGNRKRGRRGQQEEDLRVKETNQDEDEQIYAIL